MVMNISRAYLVVPKLVEQPTWGGAYIVKTKGWESTDYGSKYIGQSYELFSESNLSFVTDTGDGDFVPDMDGTTPHSFSIAHLISEHPEAVLGTNNIERFGAEIKTLIKFTQAKGNSFQLHIKPGVQHAVWRAKPESWYYFEEGLATLGISDISKIDKYRTACATVERYMHSLSERIKQGTLSFHKATEMANIFITGQKMYSYVNTISIPKNTVVDLHEGGTHHSWEEDNERYPHGNILYEVQVDVRDDVSTLRSFDKGKFTEGGSTRTLHIEDYFRFLDRSPEANNPDTFMQKPRTIYTGGGITMSQVFDTPYYKMQRLDITKQVNNEYTKPGRRSFHHLFVMDGAVGYTDTSCNITEKKGHSLFVPACVEGYELTPLKGNCSVLKKYL